MKKRKSKAPLGRRRLGEPPPYLRNADGRGYATVDGRRHYFGPYDSPETRADYEQFRLGWLRQHRPSLIFAPAGRPLREILPAYLAERESAIGSKEFVDTKRNLESLVATFGDIRPDDFRATQYKFLRDQWIATGHLRHTIAKACGRVKRWFGWMVEHEFCRPETHGLLLRIKNLRKGQAPDGAPVLPMAMRDYTRTRRELSPTLRAMCRVMLFGGPRPGEVCRMKMSEITQRGAVWTFRPTKAEKKDGPTVHYFGPRVQKVLAPFLRDDDEPLFQPREDRERRLAEMRKKRKTKVQPSQVDRSKKSPGRPPGKKYSTDSFGRAVARAAARAGAGHWHPHQLRHAFGTRLRRRGVDLLTVSTLLAHESPDVTLIYAEQDTVKAALAASKHG